MVRTYTNMRWIMCRLLGVLVCFLLFVIAVDAQDIDKLEPIGAIVSFTKTADSVTFDCVDHSQVRVTMLSADLVRVRAAFTKPLPAKDHSWAIDKQDWTTPRWNLTRRKIQQGPLERVRVAVAHASEPARLQHAQSSCDQSRVSMMSRHLARNADA